MRSHMILRKERSIIDLKNKICTINRLPRVLISLSKVCHKYHICMVSRHCEFSCGTVYRLKKKEKIINIFYPPSGTELKKNHDQIQNNQDN